MKFVDPMSRTELSFNRELLEYLQKSLAIRHSVHPSLFSISGFQTVQNYFCTRYRVRQSTNLKRCLSALLYLQEVDVSLVNVNNWLD